MFQLQDLASKVKISFDKIKLFLFIFFSSIILISSVLFFAVSIGKPYMGVIISQQEDAWIITVVDPIGMAFQSDIQVGDRPVEINGQAAQTILEPYDQAGIFRGSSIKALVTSSEDGSLKTATLKDGSLPLSALIEQIIFFLVSFFFWIVGISVFFKKPRNPATRLLCLCSLVVGLLISTNLAYERGVPAAMPITIIAAIVSPWLLLHFFIVLPEERTWTQKNKYIYLVYLIPLITTILFFLVGYSDGQPLPWFRIIRLLEIGVGFVAVALVAVLNFIRAISFRTRQQMKIILISCLAVFIPILLLYILPYAVWGDSLIPSGFVIIFIIFIPLGMAYAVVTQRLLDIDLFIRRGVIYGLITLLMAAILSLAIFFLPTFHREIGNSLQLFLALVLGGVATALFGPVKSGIEYLFDKIFYKDRYDYRQIIQSFSATINSLNDFYEISRYILGTIVRTLNLSGGCLFIKSQSGPFEVSASQGIFTDPEKQAHLLNLIKEKILNSMFPNSASSIDPEVAFFIPLNAGEKQVGILCLSQKISRQAFSSNDMYLLQGLTSVSAATLRSAMLTQAVSLRDTFVSIASHELRTPLTSINGYAELLSNRNPPENTRKQWIKNILINGQRLSNMVDDLLNVTRIQSGKINLKLDKVKMDDVIAERVSIAKENTEKHKFVLEVQPDLPEAYVDRDKFGQIVGNLLSNAVKYSPNGGHIIIQALYDLPKNRIIVSVADEGIGISREDQASLFTTFHRIQRPETRGIRGSGLGLYIVKEWTEAMGGEVWLESELNKGSTFNMAVPVAEDRGNS